MTPLRIPMLAVLLAAPLATLADDAAAAKGEAPKVVFSGLADAYYTLNLTQAQDVANVLRAYDGPTGFNLNWAKLGASMAAEPAGFKIDLGFGPESTYTTNFFVLQAYGSLKLGPGTLDLGQFTTSAGFELFESNLNWLYTRGLIYQFIVPTIHQGVRYTANLTDTLQIQGSLTNGWEAPVLVIDRQLSPRKTGHLSLFYASGDATAAFTVYYGKEPGSPDARLLVDGNVGYRFGALETNLSAAYRTEGDADKRLGLNLSARYTLSEALKLSGRIEYLKDDKGASGVIPAGGNALTGSVAVIHPVGANAELRGELRYDKVGDGDLPDSGKIFAKSAAGNDYSSSSATATVAVVAWF
jgi:hypothetical protein